MSGASIDAGPDVSRAMTGSDPATLLTVSGLSKTFDASAPWLTRIAAGTGRRLVKAVDNVSFTIRAGQTLSLVGESGCGKSTTARCVTGLERPTSGTVLYRDADVQDIMAGRTQYRHEIQMIFQDPYGSLNPRWRVGRIIADPILALKLATSRAEVEDAVAQLLVDVGMSAVDAEKYPHEFSGGQCQRIAVARALASMPSLVVCDEPTSALDVSVQAQILNLMRDLQEKRGLTYLLISHNLAVVDHMSDWVGVMYLGRIVQITDRDSLFKGPAHPYTRMLTRAISTLGDIGARHEQIPGEVPDPADPPPGCGFNPRCPFAIDRCRAEMPELRAFGDGQVACHRAEELA